jgi:CheY-like chemotaxis protein
VTRRILLVDDDEMIREVAELSLSRIGGYDVTTAASGEEAITLATADPPDAILLDVMMPGLDGPETFERLQAQPATRAVPVVLLTAKLQMRERQRWQDLGVVGVLGKPFDPLRLPTDVAALLGWRG